MLPGAGILPAYVVWSPDDQYLAISGGLDRGYADGGFFIFRSDGRPIVRNYLSFQVEDLHGRVDAFDGNPASRSSPDSTPRAHPAPSNRGKFTPGRRPG